MEIPLWLYILLAAFGGGFMTKIIIQWMKSKDSKGLNKSTENKTDAESTKILAESKKLDEDANAVAVEYALKVAKSLSDQNEQIKQDLDANRVRLRKTTEELDKVNTDLKNISRLYDECVQEAKRLREALAVETQKNIELSEKIALLVSGIDKSKQQ